MFKGILVYNVEEIETKINCVWNQTAEQWGRNMLEISKKTNLLEQSIYKYNLQDVEEPNLYREGFNYEEVPKVAFNHRRVPINMPEDIWVTDS